MELASTPDRFFANRTPSKNFARSDVIAKIRPGIKAMEYDAKHPSLG